MSDILVEVAEAVPVEVNLPAKDNAIEMEVYYQDEVSLDTDLSLFYIKSGEKEIEGYVENKAKPEIDNYIETYAKPIVSEVVDNIATPIIDEYFEGTVKPSITEFANKEMAGYAAEATAQAAIATESAALAANTAQSVDVKVAEFSEQTEASKQEFIAFAGEKTEEFEQTAQQATADSLANVEKARIWAEGEQAEVETLGGTLSSMGSADLAYAIANAPEDVPINKSGMIAMKVVQGEKGDKGDKGDDGKDGVGGKDGKDGAGRNVGDIFYTTRTDTDLNGAVECNGAVYDIGDFSGEQSIGNLLANGSIPYVSLSEHASQVSSSGVCRVFGWDGGAEFKVPTIPAILLTKTQADVIGDGGTFKLANSATGAPGNVSTYGNASVDGSNWMHASFSNGTAYVSTTGDSGMLTKFPVIQYRAMVQLATTMTDDALVTATTTLHEARSLADEAVTRLNGFDETVDDAEIQINALVEDALERIEHAGDLNTNHMSITYWE